MEEPLELKPMVDSFLQGLLETSDDEGKKMPPEPAILDFNLWVPWKAERCETPDWWRELSAFLGKEDARKLAREVRASFGLPQWLQGTGLKRGHSPSSPALPCLCIKRFMPQANSIFACRDI